MSHHIQNVINRLDQIRRKPDPETEYWMARDLMTVLGYSAWRNFENVIERARASIRGMKLDPDYQIVETVKMIVTGKGAKRPQTDYFLSRYACYLIAMNGDSDKVEIATAQNYFAVQTRRQEIYDREMELGQRLEMRSKVRDANKNLCATAKESGVNNYAAFHDAGYRGLYGLPLNEIKAKKKIGKDDLLDRAGHAELAANYFRITQTEQKMTREQVKGQKAAVFAHQSVGETVRKTIKQLGGTMPEDLPPETSIKEIEKRKKQGLVKEETK